MVKDDREILRPIPRRAGACYRVDDIDFIAIKREDLFKVVASFHVVVDNQDLVIFNVRPWRCFRAAKSGRLRVLKVQQLSMTVAPLARLRAQSHRVLRA